MIMPAYQGQLHCPSVCSMTVSRCSLAYCERASTGGLQRTAASMLRCWLLALISAVFSFSASLSSFAPCHMHAGCQLSVMPFMKHSSIALLNARGSRRSWNDLYRRCLKRLPTVANCHPSDSVRMTGRRWKAHSHSTLIIAAC